MVEVTTGMLLLLGSNVNYFRFQQELELDSLLCVYNLTEVSVQMLDMHTQTEHANPHTERTVDTHLAARKTAQRRTCRDCGKTR